MFQNIILFINKSCDKFRSSTFRRNIENNSAFLESEPSLRQELFSSEQMEAHGLFLAKKHRLSSRKQPDYLLKRLAENEQILSDCYKCFLTASTAPKSNVQIGTAGEWLLDNYWLVEEQFHAIKKNMPKRYIEELPQLAEGSSQGLPRIYDLVLERISHSDGRLDIDVLNRFVKVYQSETSLTMGELWAMPLVLSLALIENLRRVFIHVMASWQDQNIAVKWADKMIDSVGKDSKSMVLVIAEMVVSNPPISSAFVAELVRCIQGQTFVWPLAWLEERLVASGLSIDKLVHQDTQKQAADQVTVSNTLNSLRVISAQNWREFVEDVSLVEQTLRTDPAGTYPYMDFATRDHYRHMVEKLASKYHLEELDVAKKIITIARDHTFKGDMATHDFMGRLEDVNVLNHVGYYLIDDARAFKSLLAQGDSASPVKSARVFNPKDIRSLFFYLTFAFAISCLISWPFFSFLKANNWHIAWLIASLAPLLCVASRIAIKLVNWLTISFIPPDFMPRMDYEKAIPPEMRTLVVIPTLIDSEDDIETLANRLEVHFLANRDKNIQFGLLTDFKDAPEEVMPEDQNLLYKVSQAIEHLNNKFSSRTVDYFFICHRPRIYCKSEGVWMGFERKRGKLADFNALLLGQKAPEDFTLIHGNTLNPAEQLRGDRDACPVRYVITLDTDTQLPRDAAWKLIGTMAHPLNYPVIDPTTQCVVAGYAVMQPRVGVTLVSAMKSKYANLSSNDPGIDPYTHAVSDVYQDLFNQGSYVGKGIYDLVTFENAVANRFPDNSILSHDLIEGCFARSGLITDLCLFEDNPSSYSADVARRHRWIRGDWQLLPWLLPKVPTKNGKWQKNPLSLLSLWKIIDNLRNSLIYPSLLTMFLIGWFGTNQPVQWTLAIVGLMLSLPLFDFIVALVNKPTGIPLRRHISVAIDSFKLQCLRTLLNLVWLPYEALSACDAILRTLWRLSISKKYLLQWCPFSDSERNSPKTLLGNIWRMKGSAFVSLASIGALYWLNLSMLPAIPLAVVWFISPIIAWWLSISKKRKEFIPTSEQKKFLCQTSRKIWAFFDHYVNEENNWLPPDNVQEKPIFAVAHRTSPTNIGLSLLVHMTAHDFRYLSTRRFLDRLDKTITTMLNMERYRKHFYNWYDTRTLEPLLPQYISAVDSGNLAGHLLTLRQGLIQLVDVPIYDRQCLNGILDTVHVLSEPLSDNTKISPKWQLLRSTLAACRAKAVTDLNEASDDLLNILTLVQALEADTDVSNNDDAAFWLQMLVAQCQDISDYVHGFLFPKEVFPDDFNKQIPTLRDFTEIDLEKVPEVSRDIAKKLKKQANALFKQSEGFIVNLLSLAVMDFAFLYSKERGLLSIGYNVQENKLDKSYYDLFASEARLAYYVAIAQNQIPQESWFQLGRMMNTKGRHAVLMSWSGSMFEYLMPELVMPSFEGTILDGTCHNAVHRQISYGAKQGLPWGISESAYNIRDASFTYQYQAFGVPELGLKRGLGNDYVVAPYASALALMVLPDKACKNLEHLAKLGFSGRYGFYEAIDYTAMRLPSGQDYAIIYCFMAHHQAMSILSLATVLLKHPMQKRFLNDPYFKATALLLEERMPKLTPDHLQTISYMSSHNTDAPALKQENRLRIFTNPNGSDPAVQLLSNSNYHVMLNSSGGGYSRYRKMSVTRWREDPVADGHGMFCYLRDLQTGEYWSSTHQPTLAQKGTYEAIFSVARAEFKVKRNNFDVHTEIVVSPEEDVELRRIHISNRSKMRRSIEITSYAEVVLSDLMSDAQHPAFNKLFVQSEIVPELNAIICSRRPRSRHEGSPHMFHLISVGTCDISKFSFETDRSRFIGRGKSLRAPQALEKYGPLSNSEGAVLDPIVSIRCNIVLNPGEECSFTLVTGVGLEREGCVSLIEKFRDYHLADRVFDLTWTHSQIQLHQFNASIKDAHLYEHMASFIIYPNQATRAERAILLANEFNQSRLWSLSISGDIPIVLVCVSDTANIELVAQMVKAHAYWRLKGLMVDLVIWNEDDFSYRQNLQDMIMHLIPSSSDTNILDQPGGIFVRAAQLLSREDRTLIQAVARLVLTDTGGSFSEQIYRRRIKATLPPLLPVQNRKKVIDTYIAPQKHDEKLIFPNQYGGFSEDGREYVIRLGYHDQTPAPWINVLANESFGCIISEKGSSYTWKENAHEFRLTPWSNDPVEDPSGEAFYLRDEESGRFWSPTPSSARGKGNYTIRHGFGYSSFEYAEQGIESKLVVYVAKNDPVKFYKLCITNKSGRSRKLSATGYVEWVLGDLRFKNAMHISTETDAKTGAILAKNPYTIDFPGLVAFFDVNISKRTVTGDRLEFLGRNGCVSKPQALERVSLSGRVGPGFDPCGAIHTVIDLDDDEQQEIVFILGAANGVKEVQQLIKQYSDIQNATQELDAVKEYWREKLGCIQIKTPNQSVNLMANGWLMYQIIASRFFARSGFYQSGGAFGFRDQLQDSMSMIFATPELVREHLLRSAAHQFPEGDVMHWWHPPVDRGVRTRCSDDYLWLPAAVERYVRITGDFDILNEEIGYIEARQLNPGEESFYDMPLQSSLKESLYQHCVRAITHSFARGSHGLPLIGAGDWNDGMNMVGIEGKGESVWLGFFGYHVLRRFAPLATKYNDDKFADRCLKEADLLRDNIEEHAWDGSWYRRAYFDDGTVLGSHTNEECKIDALSQSWSVLSGIMAQWRQEKAMQSLEEHLVRRDIGIIQLLDPPFDKSDLEPGYIKGYVPGVRENGGQYTHAAIWSIMAFAAIGQTEKAWDLLNMVNPINHTMNKEQLNTYKVEPYVLSADVYGMPPHEGRGGWSWMTGAASWMYRLIVESLVGFKQDGNKLSFQPLLPADWTEVEITYKYHETLYEIKIVQQSEKLDDTHASSTPPKRGLFVDGEEQMDLFVSLKNDGGKHKVEFYIHTNDVEALSGLE